MSIWFKPITLEDLRKRNENTCASYFGIEITEITEDSMTAIMPVTQKVKQPIGIVHGGMNVVLAETLASNAANCVVDIENFYCVGLEININHIRSVREGRVSAITRPFHLGKSTQVWHIELFDDQQRITAVSRMTASVLKR
ncbi:MAG TPA: esterase [Legionellales bacterium]|nr:esterase [Legionellales bacterium]